MSSSKPEQANTLLDREYSPDTPIPEVVSELSLPEDLSAGRGNPVERAEAVLSEIVHRFGAERIALAASWQKETAVLVDLVQRVAPAARIFTLDTGVLFPHSYAVWREVEQRYGFKVEAWKGEWVDGLWDADPDRCCHLRKVVPLREALAQADCWLTGLRRDQSPERANTPEYAWDELHGLFKAVPLATWSERDVWRYIFERGLPYNKLHDEGYSSIGCTHCTRAGEGREGRWAGTAKTECGMHA
ncbi:MAG: phosphoadenylyl-sulfate reductase [Actinomycetota bacterium]|nr:phosphoadenylyl-sulfate reductase [Actinomycetota bacterium]